MYYALIKKESIDDVIAKEFQNHKDSVLGFALCDNDMQNFLQVHDDGTHSLSDNYADSAIFDDAEDIAYYVHAMNTTNSTVCLVAYKEEPEGGYRFEIIVCMDIDSFVHQETFSLPITH